MIFETYDQSNKETLPDQRQIQTNTKTITKHDMACELESFKWWVLDAAF